jgi:hypothetical protein
MISSLSFTSPFLLVALAGLPVLWWLLRIMPPQPGKVIFPPVAFLMKLKDARETPHHTPLWLLALRLALAALIIIGLAGPIINPPPKLEGTGPVVLVVDDGWAAASTWARRLDVLGQTIDQAARDGRPLALITTAPGPGQHLGATLLSAEQAHSALNSLKPRAWPTDRKKTAGALVASWPTALADASSDFIWLTDALAGAQNDLALVLDDHGNVFHLTTDLMQDPLALTPPSRSGATFKATIKRPEISGERSGTLRAIDDTGRPIASTSFTFAEGTRQTSASFDLPLELQNTIARVEIAGERSAGAVALMDERWRRRIVGLVTAGTGGIEKPLLSDIFYVDRALAPFAEARLGDIDTLFKQTLSALILPDIGQIPDVQTRTLETWIENGGMLIRFAGPRLAVRHETLVPVPLRQGGRALGGALSWDEPQHLAPFDDTSPFYGLTIPEDVTVSKQVLAEPSIDLASHTWARLSDGTPLVTAARRGDGWSVLFHVTANPDWSTLPMSGLFVEMLERTIAWSQSNTAPASGPEEASEVGEILFHASKVLNGFGELEDPKGTLDPITLSGLQGWTPSPATPPGIYQRPAMTRALNLTRSGVPLEPLRGLPGFVQTMSLGSDLALDLKPHALTLALILALIDGLVILVLSRTGAGLARASQATALVLLFLAVPLTDPVEAAEPSDAEALRATLKTHLAWVITGDNKVDRLSERGLTGLSNVIGARTAVEPGPPIGIHLETDELTFFPLIYWPIWAGHDLFSSQAMAKLDRYMRTGGTVIFDTQDQQMRFSGPGGSANQSPNARRLRDILTGLDIPALVTVPDDHVLTKSFYLMRKFPGRWQGGQVWVETLSDDARVSAGGSLNDGVSSVIIGSNDWAAAWAVDDFGRPLAVTVPGSMRQREMAYRFGVNVVMYTLTGNYKADQVHIPALLERLGE